MQTETNYRGKRRALGAQEEERDKEHVPGVKVWGRHRLLIRQSSTGSWHE